MPFASSSKFVVYEEPVSKKWWCTNCLLARIMFGHWKEEITYAGTGFTRFAGWGVRAFAMGTRNRGGGMYLAHVRDLHFKKILTYLRMGFTLCARSGVHAFAMGTRNRVGGFFARVREGFALIKIYLHIFAWVLHVARDRGVRVRDGHARPWRKLFCSRA